MINVLIVFAVLYIPLMLVLGLGLCRTAAAADRRVENEEPETQLRDAGRPDISPPGRAARFARYERRTGPVYAAQALVAQNSYRPR